MLQFMYFDVMAKGLPLVLVLQDTGVEWERARVEDWGAAKQDMANFPFQQMPLLVDGGLRIAQSTAILNYVGRKCGRFGASESDQVVSDMLVAEAEDVYSVMQKSIPTLFVKLGTPMLKGDKEYFEKTISETFPKHFNCLEELLRRQDSAPWFIKGDKRCVGELYLWGFLYQLKLALPNILDSFPKLLEFYNAMAGLESVFKVVEGESAFGPWKQYFVAPDEEVKA